MIKKLMKVGGMTCDDCNRHVEHALEAAGAKDARAEWRRGEVTFETDDLDEERLAEAVAGAGYRPGEVTELSEVAVSAPRSRDADNDLLIAGGGSAAFAAAIRATNLGARVAIVERNTVGGTCVNVGCIPSKNLLAAAETYRESGHHPFSGIATRQQGVDMRALIGMKDDVVTKLRKEKYLDLAESYGFEIMKGTARFVAEDAVEVDGRRITAGRFLIATGAAPWAPPIEGLDDAGYLTSTTAMELKELPRSMVVVGGNYVGLEMGQLFSSLGTKVTIVEALDRLAPLEEPEISESLQGILSESGIEVATSAKVISVETGDTKTVIAEVGGSERGFEADEILVATGRRPIIDGLDLAAAGIELDERGGLILDEGLQTTNPRVFAAGDVTGAPQFVYVAAYQGTLAADNALGTADRRVDYTALPRVTFTSPNIASVGMTDEEANTQGYRCECRVVGLEHVPRAQVNLDTRGVIKVVAEADTGKILGVHLLAEDAGDVILAATYAVKFGLTVKDLADAWAPYLTMSEGLKLAAQSYTTDLEKLSCCAA